MEPVTLSERSRTILQAIADGRSYDQILASGVATSYPEVFQAATEALAVVAAPLGSTAHAERMQKIREKHPRAYEKWSPEEGVDLAELFRTGLSISDIAARLQRQPGAIRSRLHRLNLYSATEDDSKPQTARTN